MSTFGPTCDASLEACDFVAKHDATEQLCEQSHWDTRGSEVAPPDEGFEWVSGSTR